MVEKWIYLRLAGVASGLALFLVAYALLHSLAGGFETYVVAVVTAFLVRTVLPHVGKYDIRKFYFMQFSSGFGIYAFIVVLLAAAVIAR